MALFGKKPKTAEQLKAEIDKLQQQLEAIEGPKQPADAPEPPAQEAPAPAPEDTNLNKSASNTLFATLSHELRTPPQRRARHGTVTQRK